MAKAQNVWGIEIGQSSLKAMRCHLEGEQVVTDAFDFIEYPKILSQPEAEPEKLIAEALEQFLSRNETKGCKVAVSVPGQSGLAKFFKPPPMDAKKIPDIVKYEAKQQIPYDLNEVIWDYQRMPGAMIEEGFAFEAEVGLFAMKRDAVYRALKPLRAAGLEIDVVQLAPLAIYNMVAYDRFDERLKTETFDSEAPPSSTVVLAMGTDSTDLIVTNGFRVWQRSMPLGGNHFTRQLTKDLKLTFAKAEHLKKNAMAADDPKLVFQAMKPVFNDMVTEVQRSVSFYKSLNKKSDLAGMMLLGNSTKLPGLQPFLNKNLGYEVEICDTFKKLEGGEVLNSPAFKEHQLAFGVVYGLCLQLLGLGPVQTNLIPKEIVTERMIRAKKPWAVIAASLLMLGMLANIYFLYRQWHYVHPDFWKGAIAKADETKSQSDTEIKTDEEKKVRINLLSVIGSEVAGNADRRLMWLELLRAVNAAIPRDAAFVGKPYPPANEFPYAQRKDVHVETLESRYFDDLTTWFDEQRKKQYLADFNGRRELLGNQAGDFKAAAVAAPGAGGAAGGDATAGGDAAAGGDGAAAPPADAAAAPAEGGEGAEGEIKGPEGAGWVIELKGYHYYRDDRMKPTERANWEKQNYVRRTLLENIENGSVVLPADLAGTGATFTFKELGIGFPMMISGKSTPVKIPNPEYYRITGKPMPGSETGGGTMGGSGGMGMGPASSGGGTPGTASGGGNSSAAAGLDEGGSSSEGGGAVGGSGGLGGGGGVGGVVKNEKGEVVPPSFDVEKYEFVVQFCWLEKPLSKRVEERLKAEAEAKQKADEAAGAAPAVEDSAAAGVP
jgi:type IV pilus assembly protein PilM